MAEEMREARFTIDLITNANNINSFAEKDPETTYSFLSFNNTQMDMEVSITSSITTGNNVFEIVTWNLPTNRTLSSGDQITIRVNWMQDVKTFKLYSGYIETIVTEVDGQDLKYTITGALIDDFLMNTIRPRTVSERSYSNIIKTLAGLQSTLQLVGISSVTCVIPDWENLDHELPHDDIQIGKKTVLEILQELKVNFKTELGKEVSITYREQNNDVLIALYSDQESYGTITVLVLGDEDLFAYRMETVDTTNDESDAELYDDATDTSIEYEYEDEEETVAPTVMVIQTTGVIGFMRNAIFKYNGHYYITSDVIHSFSDSDGYLMEIYANVVG